MLPEVGSVRTVNMHAGQIELTHNKCGLKLLDPFLQWDGYGLDFDHRHA